MIDEKPEVIAAIAGTMRSRLSRRRLLGAAGLGGAAMLATACGASDEALGSGSGGQAAAAAAANEAPDLSLQEKVLNWSNWPLYIDVDDNGNRPTLDAFQKLTGIEVTYTEDVNDNNEFYAKVRTQLEQGQDIGRDLVILTDWMAAIWIRNNFAERLDKSVIPNWTNMREAYMYVSFDPGRQYSLPWQSGFGALGWNKAKIQELLGTDTITSVEQLFDPKLKGRVTVLSEMRDTMGILMAYQGANPSNFTDDEYNKAIELLTQQVDNGQIRQVTGNDYAGAMESGDVVAGIVWSGDMVQLGDSFGVGLPETGGTLWTDNMLIPALAQHKLNAELLINYYYDPVVAAKVAAYVQYVSPVEGAQEAMKEVDPSLVDNPWIFPTTEMLDNSYVFMTLSDEQNVEYERAFQKAIGG